MGERRSRSQPHASSSIEQTTAEPIILTALAKRLGLVFGIAPAELSSLDLDGFAAGKVPVLVEVFAHVGRCKPGQQRKLSRDMTKLLLAERLMGRPCRKVVAVVDPVVQDQILRAWDGEFARRFGIEFVVVFVPENMMAALRAAQARQGFLDTLTRNGVTSQPLARKRRTRVR